MMRFRSKIGLELIIPLTILLGGMMLLFALSGIWSGFLTAFAVAAFTLHIFVTTVYTIDGTVLRIRSGFIYSLSIDISTITSIAPTRNAISSPAASLDRLIIRYNRSEYVLISPAEKNGFLNRLTALNPSISVSVPGFK
jgi:hypothetical protein